MAVHSERSKTPSLYEDYVDILGRVRQFYNRLDTDARKQSADFRELQMILGSVSNGERPIESILEQVYQSLAPLHKLTLDFRSASTNSLLTQLRELLAGEKRDPKMEDKLRVCVDKLCHLREKEGLRITGPNVLIESLSNKLPSYLYDSLLHKQLDISWDTENGYPAYEEIFHNPPMLSWRLRKMLTMYQIFKSQGKIEDFYKLEDLCPPIYAKTMAWQSWYKWNFVEAGDELPDLQTSIGDFPHWIDKDIHDFLNAESQEECYIHGNFAVYCLVIKDELIRNFKTSTSSKDTKKGPRDLQLYIGSAVHGTLQRWIHDSRAHCKAVSSVLKHLKSCPNDSFLPFTGPVSAMETCLALATLLSQPAAIFVISSYHNKEGMIRREDDLVQRLNLTDMRYGLNYPGY